MAAMIVLLDNVMDFSLILLYTNAARPKDATNIFELILVGMKVKDTGKK